MAKSETGIIFNIQKFSLNDGPGIRTVVFLKGCPLHCAWCANPESQGPARLSPEEEAGLQGWEASVGQVVETCLQDKPFYEESGGGVTLSGGEPPAQPAFACALLTSLGQAGLHTALETTGCVTESVFRRAAALTDYFLFDMKHWDEARHKQGTGQGRALIDRNMAWALSTGREVLPRIPVIPGYNDSLEDAAGFARKLLALGAKQAQLLPFHQLGESKYDKLGKDYAYRDRDALHEEDLEAFRQAMGDAGVKAFF